ncbi:MAG: IS200/IS605 family transposase [Anaerolineales bacterium]|jgi:REP element-mobilizing transposase RayT/ActR/RegA family two-component response regulator
MTVPLLVVTSDIPFGELLHKGLEETGRFGVRVTGDQESAVAYVQEVSCPLAFLDAATEEDLMVRIGRALRLINPEIRFVVISEVGWHTTLEKLFPLYYLSKPFHFPDLFEMMDKFFPASEAEPLSDSQPSTGDELPWLADVNRAAQHLTRLTLESSAQAALITREGQLWAYAGQLPQSATSELTETLGRYWDREEQNDLVRFVRLTSTNAEHMLYATCLSEGMVLALVFDAETPFSTIRTQANQLVHSLSASPVEEKPKDGQVEEEIPRASLSDILADVPSPNPTQQLPPALAETLPQANPPAASLEMPRLDLEASQEFKPLVETDQVGSEQTLPLEPQLDETQALPRQTKSQKKRELNSEDLAETLPGLTPEGGRRIVLEPVSPSVYDLTYDCLFIPRFTTHYLTGDLADRLSDWMQQICVAFGWRLEYISVRPDYLQWIVNVPPATSPAYLMRILRQQTSEKIFDEFPRFKKENPSGDFWAPGYLIMGGSQPAPAQLIKDFIAQTRQRQGIIPPLR